MRCRIALATITALLAACGDNLEGGSPDAPPGDAPPECPSLALGEAEFQFNWFGQLTGLRYPVVGDLGGAAPDYVLVELYDSTTEGLPALAAGTFDLAAPPNDNLATCQHCLWLWQDFVDGEAPTTVYYANSGELTLTHVVDPFEPQFAGSTGPLVIRTATFDPDTGDTSIIPGGACFSIAPLAFDTRVSPGRACASAEDCGNPLLEVCDPGSATCTPPQCDEFQPCDKDEMCVSQYREQFQGACYRTCNPLVSSCGEGQACIQFGVDVGFGVCRHIGEGAAGTTCAVEDVSTSCVAGLTCDDTSDTCLPTCNYFAEDTGCTAGNTCYVLGGCRPTTSGASAAIGQPCGANYALADGCASDGEAFRGICFAFEPDPLVCERACLGDVGCGDGEFCALRFSSGLGICRPIPVCGDGEIGEINEVCDDGNTDDDDGCSGDCEAVEYDVLCGSALDTLAVNTTTSGTTLGGIDGFQASCQFGRARAQLWSVTPPGRGRLRVHVESATRHIVSARSDCDDDTAELGCKESAPNDDDLIVQITSSTPGPVTVLVTAGTVLEEGPFTIQTEFIAEDCGDGVLAGDEVCDDGDTDGNDGCSADCRTIEYTAVCEAAPVLSTTSANTGDTTGGTPYFEASCSNTLFGSGPERLYRYTAPANGTLSLRLDQGQGPDWTDLTLAVFESCGAPGTATELACSSVVDIEEASVTLTAGQEIIVLVEGFSASGTGPYTLTATFTP